MAEIPEELAAALSGRYALQRELGRGGMATVHLAHDLKHDRPVALKVLDPRVAALLGAEPFLREIRITARLDHPHIVPVFDSGEDAGRLWYTMPYIKGETLRERLRREGPLPLPEAVRLTREVADALECAHAHGIVHRDVKPENILLTRGHARVADFGVARALAVGGGNGLTTTGMVVGPPAYMSPEQALGDTVDPRADVYSLGCVAYEILAGKPPYSGITAQAILAKRLSEPVPRLRTVRQVPGGIEDAVARALARHPDDRFRSPGDLAAALEAAASGARLRAPEQRPIRLLLVVGLGVVIVAAGMLTRSWRPERQASAAAPAPDYEASIAILPFATVAVGGDSTSEYFSEGMTDEIITQLAQVRGLKVISRSSVVAVKHRSLTLPQVAETLGVRHVVEGSIRRTGDSVRVNVQMVDAIHVQAARTAAVLDPLSPGVRTGLAAVQIIAGNHDLALAESRRAVLMEPSLLTPIRWNALTLVLLGRGSECVGEQLRPTAALWAACLHASGARRRASGVIDSLEQAWRPEMYALATDIAKYYALAGNAAAAATWYERSQGVQGFFLHSAVFDRVRETPEFGGAPERLRRQKSATYRATRHSGGRP